MGFFGLMNLSVSRWDWGEQWDWSETPLNFPESECWDRILQGNENTDSNCYRFVGGEMRKEDGTNRQGH